MEGKDIFADLSISRTPSDTHAVFGIGAKKDDAVFWFPAVRLWISFYIRKNAYELLYIYTNTYKTLRNDRYSAPKDILGTCKSISKGQIEI